MRYVDLESCCTREDLVEIIDCDSGVNRESLATRILRFITHNIILYPMKLHGYAYDGESNKTAGKTVLYTH